LTDIRIKHKRKGCMRIPALKKRVIRNQIEIDKKRSYHIDITIKLYKN
jgi:hypothetical protein